MSKKKQLTGKKTKLAKLPLTRVLSQNLSPEDAWEPPPAGAAPSEAESLQLPLSWEQLEEGAQGLLAAAYVLILKDLLTLKAVFADGAGEKPVPFRPDMAAEPPPPTLVKQALRQVKVDLGELAQILAG